MKTHICPQKLIGDFLHDASLAGSGLLAILALYSYKTCYQ